MQGKNKVYLRHLTRHIQELIRKRQSALILGPRQTGKTTLVKETLKGLTDTLQYPLQHPEIRQEMEADPSRLVKQITPYHTNPLVFIDEAQKAPDIFDGVQYLIDEKKAHFIITGSSARKLRRKGVNLLPGRLKTFRLDPLLWSECGWIKGHSIERLTMENINEIHGYSFKKSLIFGSLPGIVGLPDDNDRRDILTAYTRIYLEEEIRAEALSRKIGAFGRFLQLAARESGTNPNLTKLSWESGVSAPTIKEFYRILEDTLVVEKVAPYTKNVRKRILTSPRYYFFDLGVRNALARAPLTDDLLHVEQGKLFEHAVVLEIIRRLRVLQQEDTVHYWRTSGGAEVDCIIDTGRGLIPIEIKSGARVSLSDVRGLQSFIQTFKNEVRQAYVVTNGRVPEQLSDQIMAIPWMYL